MTESTVMAIGLVFLAYLWGSIPTAVIVCHALNIPDPRKQGSGNPGTTNVLRIGSRKAAGITLIGDAGKGFLALLPYLLLDLDAVIGSACTLAVITGHMLPVFSSFRGGKGIATTFGACLGLYWPLALMQFCTWALLVAISRTSSLASVSTALITPLFIWLAAPEYLGLMCIIAALLVFSHRQNIRNILDGKEPRL
ncbi:MAG: acyl-phosphate glycerol 3-phosphate acyltransferase [Neptuniibacter caesariensis]|uniref:Glycerol-3-phosphate acyltransferase n=1 Tax=Neptuniibacter caesariensis TaxID=207954 RepID=A0A2G6JN84_NEPCE|nr:MAG: acyl-phosphate glycerol 3-phosphate acyltransferase [Neptuniibacter caesariensis]